MSKALRVHVDAGDDDAADDALEADPFAAQHGQPAGKGAPNLTIHQAFGFALDAAKSIAFLGDDSIAYPVSNHCASACVHLCLVFSLSESHAFPCS